MFAVPLKPAKKQAFQQVRFGPLADMPSSLQAGFIGAFAQALALRYRPVNLDVLWLCG
jgi:hypothetical protein